MFESSLNYPEAFKWYSLALDEDEVFAKKDYIRVAKILGYEEVVRILRSINKIPYTVPQHPSLAMLLPSDSPLAKKEADNNSNQDNRIGPTFVRSSWR